MDGEDEPEMVEAMTSTSGRSFWDRLFFLSLAYALTTLVGGYLAYHFQERGRINEQQAALFDAQKSEAMNLFREVSDLMGERSYLMLRIQFGSKSAPFPDDYEARWEAYREMLHTWNAGRFTRRAMIDAYFGRRFWSMERDIHYKFRDVGIVLEEGHRAGAFTADQLAEVEAGMNDVTSKIKAFNQEALRAILHGEVGIFGPEDMGTFGDRRRAP